MTYYFDCDCEEDHWLPFTDKEAAKEFFYSMPCSHRLLYDEDFKTILLERNLS